MSSFDIKLLASRVREKRGNRTLRDVSEETQIGIATLSRVENGQYPDVPNLAEIIAWLGDNPADYFIVGKQDNDAISIQLRAVQGMSSETASAFMDVIRAAYAEVLENMDDDKKA